MLVHQRVIPFFGRETLGRVLNFACYHSVMWQTRCLVESEVVNSIGLTTGFPTSLFFGVDQDAKWPVLWLLVTIIDQEWVGETLCWVYLKLGSPRFHWFMSTFQMNMAITGGYTMVYPTFSHIQTIHKLSMFSYIPFNIQSRTPHIWWWLKISNISHELHRFPHLVIRVIMITIVLSFHLLNPRGGGSKPWKTAERPQVGSSLNLKKLATKNETWWMSLWSHSRNLDTTNRFAKWVYDGLNSFQFPLFRGILGLWFHTQKLQWNPEKWHVNPLPVRINLVNNLPETLLRNSDSLWGLISRMPIGLYNGLSF